MTKEDLTKRIFAILEEHAEKHPALTLASVRRFNTQEATTLYDFLQDPVVTASNEVARPECPVREHSSPGTKGMVNYREESAGYIRKRTGLLFKYPHALTPSAYEALMNFIEFTYRSKSS